MSNGARRALLLLIHFARNLGYYRARTKDERNKLRSEFWKTADGNFLDIAVLEWCKVLGEPKGEHHWRKVVVDETACEYALHTALNTDADGLETYRKEMRDYRDKFVAHLDRFNIMQIPTMEMALTSACALHSYILDNDPVLKSTMDIPSDLRRYYENCVTEAKQIYA